MPLSLRFVVALLGALAIVASLWLRRANARAQGWPSIRGRVIRSDLRADPHDAGSSVEVHYEYALGARSYVSSRLGFAAFRDDAPAKERLLARFPLGAEVEVFYDPSDPSRCVLLREPSLLWLGACATGLLLIGVAVLAP
jgi:hypothetical protein